MGSIQTLLAPPGFAGARLRRVVLEDGPEDLARRAGNGDRAAFSALMTAHKDRLYRFVLRRVAGSEDAYDIVQETFVSAWSAMARFDPERPFAAWLKSIALNKCRDRARRAFVRRALFGTAPAMVTDNARDEAASPEENVIARDEIAALQRAMDALPRHFRDALMLTAVDGLSQAATAAALGCSIKAVEYRVSRAREIVAGEIGLDRST